MFEKVPNVVKGYVRGKPSRITQACGNKRFTASWPFGVVGHT